MKFRLYLALFLLLSTAAYSNPVRQYIDAGWSMRQGRGYNWYEATVPGTVHTDLMAAGIIVDPFFGINERGVQWGDKEDWIYRTTFDVDAATLARGHIKLVFEGLDTYADVTLNGDTILHANNMFRRWDADVKRLLKPEGNELQIYFHSPIKIALPMWEATPWRDIIESGNDQSANGGLFNARVGVFVRKAGYHFGWDWGPRLVTSGIWKPVYIESWDAAKIDDVFYRQVEVDSRHAKVEVTVETDLTDGEIIITNLTNGRRVARYKGELKGLKTIEFTVDKPRLWWTKSLGEPFLYEFETKLLSDGKVIDSHRQKLGLRSLKVVVEPDKWGESFYVELNGVPVFMKGANYIPMDVFLPRVTDNDYEDLIRDAVFSNMNMLRVWGGGIYENDVFYDLCDRYGILVWQDFMFSCALYPAEGDLMENIKEEARQNVRRLRNHTCMALWCGNNECLDMWAHWGVKRRYERYNPEWAAIQWRQFTDLYYKVLPEIVAEEHPGIAYRKSSPYSDDNGLRSDSIGDYHDWDVWGQGLEFDLFNHKKSRFFSEYGFQGFPSLQTIQRFAPNTSDWSPTSEVMLSHQRAGTNGNQKIDMMMKRDYGQPRDFECFTYLSQLMQADAMRTATEAHRREMPRCMGSLIWQMNDCWPVASWSGRDYYGKWKAQQYAIKRAFDDILISPIVEEGELRIYAVSDRQLATKGTLTVGAVSLNIEIPPLSSVVVWKGTAADSVVNIAYEDASGRVYTNNFFVAKHKDTEYSSPTISSVIRPITGGYEITLTTDVFVHGVCIVLDGLEDYFLSDNYFDMTPGRSHIVRILTDETIEGIDNRLRTLTYLDAITVGN
jgi:beta-mannosidase